MSLSAPLRAAYLHAMLARYGTVTLPIADAETHLALGSVFLPLHLRRDPLVAEDRDHTQRRALLGETPTTAHDKSASTGATDAVIAASGTHALALTSTRRLVILGGPGTGKTTVLKDLLCTAARAALRDPAAPLPIFVLLPDLARSGQTMADYLLGVARTLGVAETVGVALWEALSSGNAFLCLDSLDEVAPALRPDSIRLIAREVPRWGGTCIVGSRFTEYRGGQFGHESFAEWEVTALTHESRLVLAARLLPALRAAMTIVADADTTTPVDAIPSSAVPADVATTTMTLADITPSDALSVDTTDTDAARVTTIDADATPQTFVAAVEAHSQAAAWGENPLLFSLAAVVFTRLGQLPIGRAALYHEVLSAVLETRLPDADRRAVLEGALAELALRLYMMKGRTFTRAEIVDHLPAIRAALAITWSDATLATAILDCGALEVVAHETYGFRHLTFQEYLAADALARRLVSDDATVIATTQDFLWSKYTYSRWTEVLRLLVGILLREHGNVGSTMARWWLDALATQSTTPEGDPGDLGLALAIKSLVEATASESNQEHFITLATLVITAWAERIAAPLLDDRNQQTAQRDLGIEIRHLPLAAVHVGCAPLIAIMATGSSDARSHVLFMLEQLADHAPFAVLIAALHDPIASSVRSSAAHALGAYGAPAIPVLWGKLHDTTENRLLRSAAGEALAKLTAPGLGASVRILASSANADDRELASRIMVRMTSDVPFDLLPQLLRDKRMNIRRNAALVYYHHHTSITDVTPLLAALTEENSGSMIVFNALGVLGARAPIATIIAYWEATHEIKVMSTLQKLAPWVPVARLIDLLPTVDGKERERLGILLLYHFTAQLPEALIATLLADPRKEYSLAPEAALAIGKRAHDIAPELLQRAFSHPTAAIRRNVLNGCKHCAILPEQFIPTIIALAQDDDSDVQDSAIEVLGSLRVLAAKPTLIALLAVPSRRLRAACVAALLRLGEPGDQLTTAQIRHAIADPLLIRADVIALLGTFAEEIPIDLLLPFLAEPDASIRQETVTALSMLQEHTPLAAILPLLHDPSLDVRRAVIVALNVSKQGVSWVDIIPLLHAPDLGITKEPKNDYHMREVRCAIIDLIGAHPEFAGDDLLISCLADLNPRVTAAVVTALVKRRASIAIVHIRALLQHAPWTQNTLDLLAFVDEDASIALLLDLLAKIEPDTRNFSIIALGRALRSYGLRVQLEPLLQAASSVHAATRSSAILALGGQKARIVRDLVVQSLTDPATAAAAIETLAWRSDLMPIRDHAASLLAMGQYDIPNALHDALRDAPDVAPVEAMLEYLTDDNPAIRRATFRVLSALGERTPVASIAACLQDTELFIRVLAAQALRAVGPHAPLAALTAALDAPSLEVRWEVARAIVAAGGEPPIAIYIEGLQASDEEDDPRRDQCAAIIRELGLCMPITEVQAALGDSQRATRTHAAQSLRAVAPDVLRALLPEARQVLLGEAPGPILQTLIWHETFTQILRWKNINPLPDITFELLGEMLDWHYWEVRVKAATLLSQMQRNIPDALLQRLYWLRLHDALPFVRQCADRALAAILAVEGGIEDD